MSTSKKLDQITELTMALQNSWQGLTIEEICEMFELKRRAIERLMEVVKEKFGNRLEYVNHPNDRKRYWRLKKGSMNFLITFSDLELSKLENLSKTIKSEAERKYILNIIEKIKTLNSKPYHQDDIDILLEAQGFAVRQYVKENINPEFIEKISFAIQSEQKLKIFYTTADGYSYAPVIEPYGIKISDVHYLIAKEDGQLCTYKVSRINDIKVLEGEYFDKDEDFDIQEYCNKSFGIFKGEVQEVVLRFFGKSAEHVKNYHFHPTQTMEEQEDKSVIVKFRASGSFEIVTELLKWREGVQIISPQALKEEYTKTVRLMYENIMKG